MTTSRNRCSKCASGSLTHAASVPSVILSLKPSQRGCQHSLNTNQLRSESYYTGIPNLTCLGQIPLVASPLPTLTAVSATYQELVMLQTQSLTLLELMQSNWAVLSCLLIETLGTWLHVRQKSKGIHSSVGLLQHLVESEAQHTPNGRQNEFLGRLLIVSNQQTKE